MVNIKTIFNKGVLFSGLLFSTMTHALYLTGNEVYTLEGNDDNIETYDTSALTMDSFSGSASVNAYNHSTINVSTIGSISHFTTHNNSTANIFDGNFSFINVLDNSQANVYGIGVTSWFVISSDAHLTVFGENLMYQNGHVSGIGSSGYHFGFDVKKADEFGRIIEGTPTNVTLSSVPLPASLLLFLSGGFTLFAKINLNNRKKS